jgi:hypothetical protein
MRGTSLLTLLAAAVTLSACGADFNSIGRRTTLPSNKQMAIHLDAQQRVVMVGRNGVYCAEPSPDAIAAYAQAAALGVSVPGQGAGSGAGASQSDVASIGLRTQSITLMRDALYRLCEAGANSQVSAISATQLLARSQDLTAVVVAVEQMTGATVAAQAALSHTANSNATATAIGGADQIDAANKNVERKEATRQRAETDLNAKKAEVDKQEGVVKAAEQAATDETDEEKKPELEATAKTEREKLDTLKRQQTNLETRLSNAQEAESRARDIADKVASQGTAADTSAGAGTSGSSDFSENTSAKGLTDASAKEVAKSVETMVTTVLNKDYTGADCMVLLTNISEIKVDAEHKPLLDNTLKQCERLLAAKIQSEVDKIQVTTFEEDGATERLKQELAANEDFRPLLKDWVRRNYPDGSVTDLLYSKETADLRKRAVVELNVP